MLENIFFNHNYREIDIEGNLIERPKSKYPYTYSDFTVYINRELKDKINSGCYSDRMFQWGADKFNKCCNEVWGNKGQNFYIEQRTPKQIEKFLTLYFEKPITLVRVKECCNQASGYPVWYFSFIE